MVLSNLYDTEFQLMFVSQRDFKPDTTILQTAGQRSIYFDVKEAHNKMMQKFNEEVMKLRFNNKGNEIGREFLSDLFYSIAFKSDEISHQDSGSCI